MADEAHADRLLERALNHIAQHWDAGDMVKVEKALARARKQHPDNLTILEWQALLALEGPRREAALEILDVILKKDPRRRWTRLKRAELQMELGRFRDAIGDLRAVLAEAAQPFPAAEEARVLHDLGICFDHLYQVQKAEEAHEKAANLDPADYPRSPRLSPGEFDAMVKAALATVPVEVQAIVSKLNVLVRDFPTRETGHPFALGSCEIGPRAATATQIRNAPSTIFIFKRNIELNTPKREDMGEQVRKTVIHEIAHHFGIPHERMGEYE